jgi:hypothetical protein
MDDQTMWYVAIDGEAIGPMPRDELLRGLRSGEYNGETMVFTRGMSDWAPVAQISELAVPILPSRAPSRQTRNEEKRAMAEKALLAELMKRFERNNRPFERLKKPSVVYGAQAQRNFEQCMGLWDELRAREDKINQAWVVAQVYCRDLEDYALGRRSAEQEYLEAISPARESLTYYPPDQPTDASQARPELWNRKRTPWRTCSLRYVITTSTLGQFGGSIESV